MCAHVYTHRAQFTKGWNNISLIKYFKFGLSVVLLYQLDEISFLFRKKTQFSFIYFSILCVYMPMSVYVSVHALRLNLLVWNYLGMHIACVLAHT